MMQRSAGAHTRRPLAGRLIVLLLPALVILVWLAQPARSLRAASQIDQSQTVQTSLQFVGGTQQAAQTFTASLTGTLDQINVPLGTSAPGSLGTIIVEIRNVAPGGVPTGGPTLGQGTLAPGSIAVQGAAPFPFISVPLTPPVEMIAGTRYAVVIRTTGPAAVLLWGGGGTLGTDLYPGGASFLSPGGGGFVPTPGNADFELAFESLVTVPSPTQRVSADVKDDGRQPGDEQRQQRERTNRSNRDDERTEGNVLAVACEMTPPHLTLANRDGTVTVVLYGEAAKACNAVHTGAYVEAYGVKQHEFLFEADDLSIER